MSLLGIDVGTTGVKAAAFSADGARLAAAYREYPAGAATGPTELNSGRVLELVWETIAEAASQTAADPVSALSVSSMGEAVTPVSAAREVLAGSILMTDHRGAEQIEQFAERISQEAFYQINPNILGPHYSLPKMLWLREHDPDLYARTDKFLAWSDLVAFMLGAPAVTSYSLANRTLLFDIRKEDWSDELLSLSGVDRGKLPRAVASGTVAGQVTGAMAARLGLPAGVRIVVGGHDQALNALGAGVCQAGRSVCGIGTFECISPVYDHIPPAATMLAHGLNVEHHVLGGLYLSFLYSQGGSLIRWFRDTFASADRSANESADIYDVLSREMPPEPTRLLVLPHFDVTGPPRYLADAAGAVLGLKTATTRGQILKAIMEGQTFYFVELVEVMKSMGIDASEFIATGGGAKSDAWLQIKADILGVPFVRLRNTECGVAGAAVLAGLGAGVYADPSDAMDGFVQREKVFTPDPARHAIYADRYALYQQISPRIGDLLN